MHVNEHAWMVADDNDPSVLLIPSERTSRLDGLPMGLVWHWTAGDYGRDVGHGDSEALCRSVAKRPGPKDPPGGSWHFLIDRDGTIFQCVPLNLGAWHVGDGGMVAGHRLRNLNRRTVGIELENAGRLKESGGKFYAWPYWRRSAGGKVDSRLGADPRFEIPRERACPAHACLRPDGLGGSRTVAEGVFDAYDARQMDSARVLLAALVEHFGWERDVCGYGHFMFSSQGKEDPGPSFMDVHLPRMLDSVFAVRHPLLSMAVVSCPT